MLTEMKGRVIHLHNVLNLIRMTGLREDRKVMTGQVIHHEMMGLHIVHLPEKVLHHLVDALLLEAAAADIHQVEDLVLHQVGPVVLLVVHQEDPVHLQEAGDNSIHMI